MEWQTIIQMVGFLMPSLTLPLSSLGVIIASATWVARISVRSRWNSDLNMSKPPGIWSFSESIWSLRMLRSTAVEGWYSTRNAAHAASNFLWYVHSSSGIPSGGASMTTSIMCLGDVAKANELSRALREAAKCSSYRAAALYRTISSLHSLRG